MLTMVSEKLGRIAYGLDIGASGVRLAQTRRAGKNILVTKWHHQDWRIGEPEADDQQREAQRRDRITRFVRSAGIRNKSVVVELNAPDVDWFPLDLPSAAADAEESKLAEIVRWEVDRLLGSSKPAIETRHWALPRTKIASPTIMAAAARSEAVTGLVHLCDAAGVFCRAVQPAAVALARLGAALNDWPTDDIWGLLDLGASESRLVLCVDNVPTVVRRVGAGGRAWTKQVAESLKVGLRAAEIHKCEQGIARVPRGDDARSATARELSSIILGSLRNELRLIASEIERSYEYALTCYPQRRAGSLMLVGGGAAMRNLPEFLSDALSIAVCRASDFLGRGEARIQMADGDPARLDAFAVAVGLTLLR